MLNCIDVSKLFISGNFHKLNFNKWSESIKDYLNFSLAHVQKVGHIYVSAADGTTPCIPWLALIAQCKLCPTPIGVRHSHALSHHNVFAKLMHNRHIQCLICICFKFGEIINLQCGKKGCIQTWQHHGVLVFPSDSRCLQYQIFGATLL